MRDTNGGAGASLVEKSTNEGESPVCLLQPFCVRCTHEESRSLELERKASGNFYFKLNTTSRPIANKYHEGKMKRTLERELKVPEIAEREANGTSVSWRDCCMLT